MSAPQHILFACGGSPSHLNPGLSVAEHLGRLLPEVRVTFAGPGSSEQRQLVRTAGYEYLRIPARPAPRSPMQAIRFVTDNLAGYCSARWLLKEHKVTMVVGLGGYGSAALLKAAASRRTPHVLLEQNSVPGPATRWFSRTAELVCIGSKATEQHLETQTEVLCAGNPVSPGFENLHRGRQAGVCPFTHGCRQEEQSHKKRLVVLGGVGKSRILNRAVPGVLQQLGTISEEWHIVHQTGQGQLRETEQRYKKAGVDALAVTYIDELASVVFSSDLVICRAGGTTLAELALAGTPALVVPLGDEDTCGGQKANALAHCAAGACRMVEESDDLAAFQSAMCGELKQLLCYEGLRLQLQANMQKLARPDAGAEVASAIYESLHAECANVSQAA